MAVHQDTDTCLAAKFTKHSGLFNACVSFLITLRLVQLSLFASGFGVCERVGSFPLKDFISRDK